ncbi:MAG: hypothetical protein KF910_01070 [Brevundimonas sp.]|uniref:hypothetical protein n=1 Tax=Brevundimonas sp. TaxID=1871086 RepID=UPI0025BE57E3|nr:hypothetical protein [Brevundimonas sp.]MBX3476180.1 hypothetical protein [Brevundimonas sp.]
MRISVLAALGLLSLTPGSAPAQTPPEGLVWMALRDINEYGFDRDDPTNRPPLVTRVPDGMIRAVDMTDDGHTDWLVDYEAAELSSYCGTGGCSKILYVTLGDDGLMRAFDEQAHTLTFYQVDGERRVEAEVHHALCSSDASRECRYAYAWDAELRRLVERPTRDGQGIIAVGAFSPIDTSEDRGPPSDAPEAVADIWFKTRTACASVYVDDGVEIRRAALHDIPDVDGDGVRDWVVERPSPCQDSPGDMVPYPGFEVWLSRADGEAVQAYVSPAEIFPKLDVSAGPAVVVTEPACGFQETCAQTRLRWDAGSGRLVE